MTASSIVRAIVSLALLALANTYTTLAVANSKPELSKWINNLYSNNLVLRLGSGTGFSLRAVSFEYGKVGVSQLTESTASEGSLNFDRSYILLNSKRKNVWTVLNHLRSINKIPEPNFFFDWKSDNSTRYKSHYLNDHVDPPLSLVSYFEGKENLSSLHVSKINALWNQIKNRGFLKTLSEDPLTLNIVMEALKVAYIGLWGKRAPLTPISRKKYWSNDTFTNTLSKTELSIDRVCGVTSVLAELNKGRIYSMDVILASMLHEVLNIASSEDYDVISKAIKSKFGSQVLDMSEKYLRLPSYNTINIEFTPVQSENMMQMLVALCEDYTSLFIRMADRIHVMRHIRNITISPIEMMKIAQESISVYAPLAHKMGPAMIAVKEELEDSAFRIINPTMFKKCKDIQHRAEKTANQAHYLLSNQIVRNPHIKKHGKIKLMHRIKSKYQIHLKMERKNISSISSMKDIIGFRIIFTPRCLNDTDTPEDVDQRGIAMCYYLADMLKQFPGWKFDSSEAKDYIRNVKETGYQSLHHVLLNEEQNVPIEVQIRTGTMHCKAELGEAAHWYYKDLLYRNTIANSKGYKLAWRSKKQIRATSASAVLGLANKQLQNSRVFVFIDDHSTVVSFRKGVSVYDAAFNMYYKTGLTTPQVKLNGRLVEKNRILESGDVISVLEDVKNCVSLQPSWIELVKESRVSVSIQSKLFKVNDLGIFSVLGIAQLVAAVSMNFEIVIARHRGIPSALSLSEVARGRNSEDISKLLISLGKLGDDSSIDTVAKKISEILDIPESTIKVCRLSSAIFWVRMQGKYGWGDLRLRSALVFPLLTDVLPSMGIANAEHSWRNVFGDKLMPRDQHIGNQSKLPELLNSWMHSYESFEPQFNDWSDELAIRTHGLVNIKSASTPYDIEDKTYGGIEYIL